MLSGSSLALFCRPDLFSRNSYVDDKLSSERLHACPGTLQEQYVRVAGQVEGPRRVESVESDYVFVVESLLTKELKAAHATRLRFY
jgi:hypothetical protein